MFEVTFHSICNAVKIACHDTFKTLRVLLTERTELINLSYCAANGKDGFIVLYQFIILKTHRSWYHS